MRTSKSKSLRFTRIQLENWRNFTQVDVELQRRVFLVGPNASGKSNLLDVFRFLYDIVSIGGGFQEAVRKRGGVSKLRCLAARRYPNIAIHVDIGDDDNGKIWEYEIHFTQDNRQIPIIKQETVKKNGELILNRPDNDDNKDLKRLIQTHLEQVYANEKFRNVADFFSSIRYLHIVPQLVREPDRLVRKSNDFFETYYGADFLEAIARTPERTKKSRLDRIAKALKVAVPQLISLEPTRDEATGIPHLRGKYEHWRDKGAWQTEEQFSDGTLRLMGLLWAVMDGSGPLLLEEPELSLHPGVIRYIPQMLARMQNRTGRQILMSTHSSVLLDDDGIGLDEVLLLVTDKEGTFVRQARDFSHIKQLLESGLKLGEIVMPETNPPDAQQLTLFGD